MALVSVLHTSITAQAQAPQGSSQGATPNPPAQRAPAGSSTTQNPAPQQRPPAPAPAAPSGSSESDAAREQARAAYSAGQDAYAAGQYAAAEAHFALADSLVPAVQAKFWRAMSLDQLGNVPAALEAFERVLASPDRANLGAEKLAQAEARRGALAATPAELTVTTSPPGARVNVSGVELSTLTPITLRLAPGRHVVRVELPGYEPQQLELSASAGAKLTPSFTLVPLTNPAASSQLAPSPAIPALGAAAAPGAAADAAPPLPERSRVPAYVTLGIAGASAVVGTIFGIQALGDERDFKDAPTTSKADDVERNALIADMAFGVALTLGITGIVLLVADDPAPDQPPAVSQSRLRVVPYVAPTGAGAAATLEF